MWQAQESNKSETHGEANSDSGGMAEEPRVLGSEFLRDALGLNGKVHGGDLDLDVKDKEQRVSPARERVACERQKWFPSRAARSPS